MGEETKKYEAKKRAAELKELNKDNTVLNALKGVPQYYMDKAKGASAAVVEGAKGTGVGGNLKPKDEPIEKACGGSVKKYAKGGSVDGIAQRGKTRGKCV